jgi:hypothetical protein
MSEVLIADLHIKLLKHTTVLPVINDGVELDHATTLPVTSEGVELDRATTDTVQPDHTPILPVTNDTGRPELEPPLSISDMDLFYEKDFVLAGGNLYDSLRMLCYNAHGGADYLDTMSLMSEPLFRDEYGKFRKEYFGSEKAFTPTECANNSKVVLDTPFSQLCSEKSAYKNFYTTFKGWVDDMKLTELLFGKPEIRLNIETMFIKFWSFCWISSAFRDMPAAVFARINSEFDPVYHESVDAIVLGPTAPPYRIKMTIFPGFSSLKTLIKAKVLVLTDSDGTPSSTETTHV